MIEERICSYKLSKLLQEKGFDEECEKWYTYEDMIGEINDCIGPQSNSDHYANDFECTAPTHQMACDWLRKVHHICITIYPNKEKGFEAVFYDIESDVEITLQSFGVYGYHIFENSYKEVIEKALKYSLENLV